jgi:hypothetical protein
MQAVTGIVEDEEGDGLLFSVFQQESEVVPPAELILKEDAVIILKEPYFKIVGVGGYGLRVDHPTDIIWLAENDAIIPEKLRSKAANEIKSAE